MVSVAVSVNYVGLEIGSGVGILMAVPIDVGVDFDIYIGLSRFSALGSASSNTNNLHHALHFIAATAAAVMCV